MVTEHAQLDEASLHDLRDKANVRASELRAEVRTPSGDGIEYVPLYKEIDETGYLQPHPDFVNARAEGRFTGTMRWATQVD